MYGTNPLTGQCVYSTPCSWCVKFDKKCDRKISNAEESKSIMTHSYGKAIKESLKTRD